MIFEPTKEMLNRIPKLNETKHIDLRDKLIYLHFSLFGCDWYIVEFDRNDTFFGFSIINNDFDMAEWGYISFSELRDLKLYNIYEVVCESKETWTICKASKIEKIVLACGWS